MSDDTVKGWVLQRYRRAVAQAKWRMATVSLGTTTASQAVYTVPGNVVDLRKIEVGGLPYSRISTEELWDVKAGIRFRVGTGGLFAPQFSDEAVDQIELYPAPASTGQAITGLAAIAAPDIADSAEPDIPADLHEYLIDGAIAVGLARIDEDLNGAERYEARYVEGVELLRRRKNSRVGSGPSRIRVGYP